MTKRDEVINRVLAILSTEAGQSATLDHNLVTDLGFDSLSMIHVASLLENEFNLDDRSINDQDMARMDRVEEVVDYIWGKVTPGSTPIASTAEITRA